MTPENEVAAPVQSYAQENAKLVAAFESWLIAKNYSINTRKAYRARVRAFAAFLGPRGLAAADRQDARAFLAPRAETRHEFLGCRAALSTLYRFLKFADVAATSTIARIPRPRIPRPLPRCLSEREVELLITSADSRLDRAIVEVLYGSGLRVSEIANLRVENVDLKAGKIRVNRGKGNKDRIALIGSKGIEALRAYLDERNRGPLFLRYRPLTANDIRLVLRTIGKRAGLARVTPHMLRHSFATVLLNRGAGIRYVQELLGHERISTTQIYTHLATADLVRTYSRCHPHAKGETDDEG